MFLCEFYETYEKFLIGLFIYFRRTLLDNCVRKSAIKVALRGTFKDLPNSYRTAILRKVSEVPSLLFLTSFF